MSGDDFGPICPHTGRPYVQTVNARKERRHRLNARMRRLLRGSPHSFQYLYTGMGCARYCLCGEVEAHPWHAVK